MSFTFGSPAIMAPARRSAVRRPQKPPRQRRPWQAADDAYLIAEYSRQTLRAIALHLDRAQSVVGLRAKRLAERGLLEPRARYAHPAWTPAEVDAMHDLYGDKPDRAVAVKVHRSPTAVRVKAKQLGIGARDNWLTGRQVAELLGCESHLPPRWARQGYLRMQQTPFRTAGGQALIWRCEIAELERFLRERPECYEWRDIPDEPWRSMGQAAHRRADFLTLGQAGALLGVSRGCVYQHIRKGWLPGVRRFTHGRGGRREWVVRRADLGQFRPRIPALVGHRPFRRAVSA